MCFPETATVFASDADPAKVAAARARGEHVVVLARFEPVGLLGECVWTTRTDNTFSQPGAKA